MGTDRVTKGLLAAIAAGVWAIVVLQLSTASTLREVAAEVKAIGVDTEQIHEDLDGGALEDDELGRTRFNGVDRRRPMDGP